jgi:hypothetical protein
MKKLFTLAMGIVLAASAQAKTIYVTPEATGATLPATTSWSSPASLKAAIESAGVADSIFIKGGTYAIEPISTSKATPFATTMIWIASSRFILGGFAGTETNSSERAKSDVDMNGVVEPWEYTNQSIFDGQGKYMVMNIAGGTSLIDGIVLQNGYASLYHYNNATSATATTNGYVTKDINGNKVLSGTTSTASSAGLKIASAGVYKNIIIRNNTVTTKDYEGPYGTGTNSGNTIGDGTGLPAMPNNPGFAAGLTITNTATTVSGFLVESNLFDFVVSDAFKSNSWVNSQTTAPTFSNTTAAGVYSSGTVKNSIVRNNIAKGYKYTTLTSAKNGEVALRGGGIYIATATANIYNCVIANNEIQATDVVATDGIAGGGLFADNGGNVYNCTIVNNKISSYNSSTSSYNNVGYGAGAYFKSGTATKLICFNNVFWNNLASGVTDLTRSNLGLRNNTGTAMTAMIDVQNIVLPTSPYWYGGIAAGGTNALVNFLNCKVDLGLENNAVNGANFISPATVVGHSTTASDIKANWSIASNSYLLAKGSAAISGYTLSTDLMGAAFATTPAAGAYEFYTSTSALGDVAADQSEVLIQKDLITTSQIAASIRVYSLTGAIVAQGLKTNSVSIAHLPAGVYIAVAGAEKVKFVK